MSIFEVTELDRRGRIDLGSARRWVRDALAQARVEVLPLTAEVALDAGQLQFTGDPVDRIIYATARVEGAPLVTRDERLRRFDRDLTLW